MLQYLLYDRCSCVSASEALREQLRKRHEVGADADNNSPKTRHKY